MTLQERLDLLLALGDHLEDVTDEMGPYIQKASYENLWFTPANTEYQLHSIRDLFLKRDLLEEWSGTYAIPDNVSKKVGIIMAGNLPLVGFHDFLCAFVAGLTAKIKLSDKDNVLFEGIMRILRNLDSRIDEYVIFQKRLEDYDAVVATGSDNTNRYFQYYFKDYPSLFRGSRNSFTVVTEHTSDEELKALMDDVFLYFGLGCRSVTKVFLPRGFDLNRLFEASLGYSGIQNHPKYKNNLRYNSATYLMNKEPFLTNDIFLLKEDQNLASRIGVLHYEYYDKNSSIRDFYDQNRDQIQCVVAGDGADLGFPTIQMGQSQRPTLADYADDVDTMNFLIGANEWKRK